MQEQGIYLLNNAINACGSEIEQRKGQIIVKRAPRKVSTIFQNLLEFVFLSTVFFLNFIWLVCFHAF